MLKVTGAAVAGASILGLSPTTAASDSTPQKTRRKALIIGAHPDDPETGCGGTMILLKQAGWDIVNVYLTRGEAGIEGKSHEQAAAIRKAESQAACAVTGARAVFMTQTDGDTRVDPSRYQEMKQVIAAEDPQLVFTHWPVDSHRDHRVCSLLVYDAWRQLDHSFDLYYFEVMTGTQTQMFQPTDWVNIDAVVEQKRRACHCHKSQDMGPLYDGWHNTMEHFRGIEARCHYAEAFVHQRWQGSDLPL